MNTAISLFYTQLVTTAYCKRLCLLMQIWHPPPHSTQDLPKGKPCPQTRLVFMFDVVSLYIKAWARRPYTHTPVFSRSLPEVSTSSTTFGVCLRCALILSRYAETFVAMVHQGTALKQRKSTNSNPKRKNATPYWDIKWQNEWLQCNIIYCVCIYAALGYHTA